MAHCYLVHGKIREEHDNVVLNTHYQSRVVLVSTCNHLDMVTHLEELLQLVSRKLQWILPVTVISHVFTSYFIDFITNWRWDFVQLTHYQLCQNSIQN